MTWAGLASDEDSVYELPLHVLTDRQRIVVHFKYCEGWTLTRIAVALRVSKQCVSASHAAALRKMHKRIVADAGCQTMTLNT